MVNGPAEAPNQPVVAEVREVDYATSTLNPQLKLSDGSTVQLALADTPNVPQFQQENESSGAGGGASRQASGKQWPVHVDKPLTDFVLALRYREGGAGARLDEILKSSTPISEFKECFKDIAIKWGLPTTDFLQYVLDNAPSDSHQYYKDLFKQAEKRARLTQRSSGWEGEYTSVNVAPIKPIDIAELKRTWPEGIPTVQQTEALYWELIKSDKFAALKSRHDEFLEVTKYIFQSCVARDSDPRFFIGLLGPESSWNDRAESPQGAFRITQMIADTWELVTTHPRYKDSYTSKKGIKDAPLSEVIQACVDYNDLISTDYVKPVIKANERSAWQPSPQDEMAIHAVGYIMGHGRARSTTVSSYESQALEVPNYVDQYNNVPVYTADVVGRAAIAAEAFSAIQLDLIPSTAKADSSGSAASPAGATSSSNPAINKN